MDLGYSLSPSIDIGQIEGAFVQGLGWATMEDVVFLKDGQLLTRGPGNYKIPGFKARYALHVSLTCFFNYFVIFE